MSKLCKCWVPAALFIFCLGPVLAASGVGDICVHISNDCNAPDTVVIGCTNYLEIWMANDDTLGGLSAGFEMAFTMSLAWNMGYGNLPPVNEEGRAIGVWNLPDLPVVQDFDNLSPEHLLLQGAATHGAGLPPDPSEVTHTLMFDVPSGESGSETGFCVVPYPYPPGGDWHFCDYQGSYPPDFCGQEVPDMANPVADPACFPVAEVEYVCGDADRGGFVNVTDCVYLLNYIFGGGPAPLPYLAGDVDCNGFVNISDAVYIRSYIFSGGPEPCAGCP